MADEVILEEYETALAKQPDGTYSPVPGKLVTTQVLDIATASAQFNAKTGLVRVQSKGTGFWWVFGGSSPSATADTDGNRWLPADQFRDHVLEEGVDIKFDSAADA